jgi:hypothetical protein
MKKYEFSITDLSHDPKDPAFEIDLIKPDGGIIMGDDYKELSNGLDCCLECEKHFRPKNRKSIKAVHYIIEKVGKPAAKHYQASIPLLNDSIVSADSLGEIEEGLKALLYYEKISYEKLIGCEIIKTQNSQTAAKKKEKVR